MKHSLPLATLTCLVSLAGCATLPDEGIDGIDQVELPIQQDPNQPTPIPIPNPMPNPCLEGTANAVFTLPSPLVSSTMFQETAASVPGGLYNCDYRVVEYRNVNGVRQYTGFNGVVATNAEYPDMTEADCAASTFSAWVSAYHPPINGVPGYWETLRSLPSHHAVWHTWSNGNFSCNFDPTQGTLHYFTNGVMNGVTRLRVGSRLKIRHGGTWDRDENQSQGNFFPD